MKGMWQPKPTSGDGEWNVDFQRQRLINPKFFDVESQLLYQTELYQGRLRPDLATFSEGVFHRKLNVMHEIKQYIMSHMQKEFQRYRLYSGVHDFEGQKVADNQ